MADELTPTYATVEQVKRFAKVDEVSVEEIIAAEDYIDEEIGSVGSFNAATGRAIDLEALGFDDEQKLILARATAKVFKFLRVMGPTGLLDRPQREEVSGPNGVKYKGKLETFPEGAARDLARLGFGDRMTSFNGKPGRPSPWVLDQEIPWARF